MQLSLVQHASITLPVASMLLSWEMSQCLTQGQMADLPLHTHSHTCNFVIITILSLTDDSVATYT